jgi:hypothetical protein
MRAHPYPLVRILISRCSTLSLSLSLSSDSLPPSARLQAARASAMAGSRTVGASVMAGSATTAAWGPQRPWDLEQWRHGASLAVGSKAVAVRGLWRQRDPEQRWLGGFGGGGIRSSGNARGFGGGRIRSSGSGFVGFGDLPSPLALFSPLRRRGPSDARRHGVAQVAQLGVALTLPSPSPLRRWRRHRGPSAVAQTENSLHKGGIFTVIQDQIISIMPNWLTYIIRLLEPEWFFSFILKSISRFPKWEKRYHKRIYSPCTHFNSFCHVLPPLEKEV